MNFLKKLLDSEYKELCRFEKLAEEIEKLEPVMQAWTRDAISKRWRF